MANKKDNKEVTPLDIDALVEKKLNADKNELRKQVIEEQLETALKSEEIKALNLHDFIEHLKGLGKEIWKEASSQNIANIARQISNVGKLEKKLKKRTRRQSMSTGELDELKKKLLDYLKASGDKQTIGQIAKGMQSDASLIKRPLTELRKANHLTSEGEKRAMRYAIAK
jgi:hypothetical protein